MLGSFLYSIKGLLVLGAFIGLLMFIARWQIKRIRRQLEGARTQQERLLHQGRIALVYVLSGALITAALGIATTAVVQ